MSSSQLLTVKNICEKIKNEMISDTKLSVNYVVDYYLLESVTNSLEKEGYKVDIIQHRKDFGTTVINICCPLKKFLVIVNDQRN